MEKNKLLKKIIRNIIKEEYYPTFDFEDELDMNDKAKQAFLDDLGDENFKEPTDQEIKDIVNSLKQANLDLPSEEEYLKYAKENLKKHLNKQKDPQSIKNKMNKLGGSFSYN